MSRVATLALFFARDLFRSLQGIIPLALLAGLYYLTFTYANDKLDYFVALGGADLAAVCLVTLMLLAERASRAATYPLLARLPRRAELLAALLVGNIGVTLLLALIFMGVAVLRQNIRLTLLLALFILARWLVLFVFVTAFGLHLTRLVNCKGSFIVAYGLAALVLLVRDEERVFLSDQFAWLGQGVALLTHPVSSMLTAGGDAVALPGLVLAGVLTLGYAAALFGLAAWLFQGKDLLWVE
jgi:hypothetical protein